MPTQVDPPHAVDLKDRRVPLSAAPAWHTCTLFAALAAFALFVRFMQMGSAHPRLSNLQLYWIVSGIEWILFAFVLWHSGDLFPSYVGRVFRQPKALLWDIPLAAVLMAILFLITGPIVRLLGPAGWDSTKGMLPHTHAEVVSWIVMAITAGVCEETIFRGYLQQQLLGWTRSAAAAILLQGIVFGVCHAYQNWKHVLLISVWGWTFGLFAWLRRGLRPNVLAHAAIDIFSGLA